VRVSRCASAFVACVVVACSAPKETGGRERADGGRVLGVQELPPDQVDALAAYGRGGEAWEKERVRVLADPKLVQFMVDNLIVELARAHRGLAGADPARARRAFDRAGNELVRFGDRAVPTLVSMLAIGDAVVASLIEDVLVRIGAPAVDDVLPLLDDPAVDSRRRGAAALARMPHGLELEERVRDVLARHAHGDPEWIVRAESVHALGARGARDVASEPWRVALEACLADTDPIVTAAAAQGLSALADPRAVPALVSTLDRAVRAGDVRVSRAVERALIELTGEPPQSDVRAWRDWWFEHRREIEQGRTFGSAPRARE
jgi:hypothetical protein